MAKRVSGEWRPEAGQVPPTVPSGPEDREADGGQHERPREVAPEPEPRQPEQDQQADDDESDAHGPARRSGAGSGVARLRSVGRSLERGEEPDQDVDHEAEARGKRGCDKHGAHDVRPHAEVLADAAGHARNPAVAAAALEAGSPFTGVDLGHAGMFP